MPDREKAIKAAEICLRHINDADCPIECPYFDLCAKYEKRVIFQPLIRDVLALLKEQKWHLLTEDDDGVIHGLPGDDGQYIMTDGKEIWIDDYVDGVDDGVWLDSGRDIREIKAWMYMPDLPKQEGQ